VNAASVDWRVTAAAFTATPSIAGVSFGAYAGLALDKTVTLKGVNGLRQIALVESKPHSTAPGADPLLLDVTVTIGNPSIASVQFAGTPVFALAMNANGAQFAEMSLPPNFVLRRGDNTVTTTARLMVPPKQTQAQLLAYTHASASANANANEEDEQHVEQRAADAPFTRSVTNRFASFVAALTGGAPTVDVRISGARVDQAAASYLVAAIRAINVVATFDQATLVPLAVINNVVAHATVQIATVDIAKYVALL
jgi:hypothetical protein